jgi:hypothetical protein
LPWEGLLNIAMLDVLPRKAQTMRLFSRTSQEKLRCPYKGCEKRFDKPTVITDTSVFPRETHYTCPHCMSKLDIVTENSKIVSIKPAEYPKVFDSPAKCAHFSGLLNAPPESMLTQEECLVCPKVLQCNIRKK